MEQGTIAVIAGLFTGVVATLLVLPVIARLSRENNHLQRDLSQPGRVYYPKLGGASLPVGILAGASIAALFLPDPTRTPLFLLVSSVLLAGTLGLLEDLYGMGWKTKTILPVVCSLPLIASRLGHTLLDIPLIGTIDLGILYLLVLIPIGVTGGINAIGMIGKVGNIEAAMSLVLMTGMTTAGVLVGVTTPTIVFASTLGALIGFISYNIRNKIFLGYSGTFVVGASIVAGAIGGDMEKIGVAMLSLYFVNLAIHLYYVARHKNRGKPYLRVDEEGRLYTDENNTLLAVITRTIRPTRRQLFGIMAVLQALVCMAVIVLMV